MPHLLDLIAPPAIIVHRGVSARAPEGTLAAFRLVGGHGTDGIGARRLFKIGIDGIITNDPQYARRILEER